MGFFEFIEKGGIVMYPIIFFSIISLTVFFERIFAIREAKVIPSSFLRGLQNLLSRKEYSQAEVFAAENGSSFSRVALSAIKNRNRKREEIKEVMEELGRSEVSRLEKNTGIIGITATIAPLLGLLGTVTGMLKVFMDIAQYDDPQINVLARGIYEALITTAAGLPVGIISYICYYYLLGRVERFAGAMEEQGIEALNLLKEADRESE